MSKRTGGEPMQLIVRNAQVVTVGGRFQADIGVRDGRIAQIGGAMGSAKREFGAEGRTVTPGCSMSISRKLMPCWRLPSSEVRTRQNIMLACCASEVHVFCPFTT